MPIWQASALALMTFVQEDVPTFAAALMTAAGSLTWKAGWWGCFLGIWIGDALLYAIARGIGRPLLRHSWVQRWISTTAVEQSEIWFQRKGAWLLVSSRFVPGTRLPTYLAAGFLRLPFWKFMAITGSAVAAWTLTIFFLASWAGDELKSRWTEWNHMGLSLLLIIGLVLLTRYLLRVGFPHLARIARSIGERIAKWEFWPGWIFYAPVVVHYLTLALKHRSLTLPTAANPGIEHGGFVGESKFETLERLQQIAPDLTAEPFLIPAGAMEDRAQRIQQVLEQHKVLFPFILKPDQGQRGIGVKLIRNADQIQDYLRTTGAVLVLQRYAKGPEEVGVFYMRLPSHPQGRIFAITRKRFPFVVGDGRSTMAQLIASDPRARLIAQVYLRKLGARSSDIPELGERIKLVEAGNHAQGCIFEDGIELASVPLAARLDSLSQSIGGFYFGRYDIRFESETHLREGRGFQILELNGATAEATSIYDAKNSIWSAYRTLFEQWRLAFAIGAENGRRGHAPSSLRSLCRSWKRARQAARDYPIAD